MALRSGEYDTSGVYSGQYYGWHCRWVPLIISGSNAEVRRRSETPNLSEKPIYRVEIENTQTAEIVPLPRPKEVNVTRNSESASDTVNLTVADSRGISPRLPGPFQNRLKADIRTRVRIYAGFHVSGADVMYRIFTGVLLDRQEEVTAKGSSMTLSGFSLSYILSVTPGVLRGYYGSLSGAVKTLMEDLGIPVTVMAFTDTMIPASAPVTIVEDSLDSALEALFQGQATITWYLDTYGCLVIKEQKLDEVPSFAYRTGGVGNVYKLSPGTSGRAVLSQVAVTGKDDASSVLVVSAGMFDRFGVRKGALSSNAIATGDEAEAAGQSEIERSARALKHLGVKIPFNLLMEPLRRVTVVDTKVDPEDDADPGVFGTGIDAVLDVLRFSYRLTPTGASMDIDGETDQEM